MQGAEAEETVRKTVEAKEEYEACKEQLCREQTIKDMQRAESRGGGTEAATVQGAEAE